MTTPSNQSSLGFKITINWQNPTTILKERIFYDNNRQNTFSDFNAHQLSRQPDTTAGTGVINITKSE